MKKILKSFTNFTDLPRFFSAWAIVFGVLYGLILPPFHSPDEFNHLYKIYHLSSRSWNGELNHDSTILGGYVPRNLVKAAEPFRFAANKEDMPVPVSLTWQQLQVPLNPSDTIFQEFTNTARYAPTAYAPQVAAVWLFRQFHAPPLVLLYACRLATFLFWFWLMRAALRLVSPLVDGNILVLVFLLLPISLAIHTTISADVISNSLIFYALALMLHLRAREAAIRWQEAALLVVLFVVTGVNKICYFPFLFFLLTIQKEKFGNIWKKIGFISFCFLVTIGVVLAWTQHVDQLIYPFGYDNLERTTYDYLHEGSKVNPKIQLEIIKKDLPYYLQYIWSHSFQMYRDHHVQFIGYFGWEGKHIASGLTNPFWWILALFFAWQPLRFAVWERVGLLAMAHGMTILFYLSQILHWDELGKPGEITWYGAKYFYPIYPFIFLAISGIVPTYFPKLAEKNYTKRLGARIFKSKFSDFIDNKLVFGHVFWFLMLVLHVDMLLIMLKRYY